MLSSEGYSVGLICSYHVGPSLNLRLSDSLTGTFTKVISGAQDRILTEMNRNSSL